MGRIQETDERRGPRASRQKKLKAKPGTPPKRHPEEESEAREVIELTRQHPLPGILLVLSWLALPCSGFWFR